MLAGKLNPLYTPYIDMGDHVIVINCEKIVLTGMKSDQKLYRRYTGFPGGLREESFIKLLARRPEAIVEQSIKGMLPKSKLGRQMATKLKVYKGDSIRTSPSSRCRLSSTRPTPPRRRSPSPASPRTSPRQGQIDQPASPTRPAPRLSLAELGHGLQPCSGNTRNCGALAPGVQNAL